MSTYKLKNHCFLQAEILNLEIPKRSVHRIQGIQELGGRIITSLLSQATNWQLIFPSVMRGVLAPPGTSSPKGVSEFRVPFAKVL